MYTKQEILRMVEEEDVEFIRLQFTDAFGTLRNIAVPAGQLDRALSRQFRIEGSSIREFLWNEDEDVYLYPDPDTFTILPWRPQQGKVARLLCDIYRSDDTPLSESPRSILKKVLCRADKLGYTFQVKPECEFFLFHTDENGIPTTLTHEQAGYLDISPLDLGENARRDMIQTLEEMGFEIESSHHELAPAQHEIDFHYVDGLSTADRIVTFKSAVRSIAKRHGLHATFMPKPKAGTAGSGMHIHMSLWKDGRNIFEDADRENGLSVEAEYFIGGILKHIKGMTVIANPLVNSYKRLISGFEAPGEINWSVKSSNVLIRAVRRREETVIELRSPDPSANPYLLLALCLEAGLWGMEKKILPSEAVNGRDFLPQTLKEAVAACREDEFIKDVLGEKFLEPYLAAKEKEWLEYMTQVTDWEIQEYLYRT